MPRRVSPRRAVATGPIFARSYARRPHVAKMRTSGVDVQAMEQVPHMKVVHGRPCPECVVREREGVRRVSSSHVLIRSHSGLHTCLSLRLEGAASGLRALPPGKRRLVAPHSPTHPPPMAPWCSPTGRVLREPGRNRWRLRAAGGSSGRSRGVARGRLQHQCPRDSPEGGRSGARNRTARRLSGADVAEADGGGPWPIRRIGFLASTSPATRAGAANSPIGRMSCRPGAPACHRYPTAVSGS